MRGTGVQGRDVSPTSPHLGSVGMGMYWDDQLGLARRIRAVGGELVGLNPRESGVHHRYTRLTTLKLIPYKKQTKQLRIPH